MSTPPLLHELLSTPGPSGYESEVAALWRKHAEGFAQVEQDNLGSSLARVAGAGDGPRLALVGHIDEIGVAVSHISKEGFVYFQGIGGWDPQILIGQRVVLQTAAGPVHGVIGRKPIHLLKEEERKRVPRLSDLHIDIGAGSSEEAEEVVAVGDSGVLAVEPLVLRGERIASRSLDNRLGAYVVLEAARRVAEAGGNAGPVIAIAAAQEEIGLNGARTAAWQAEPQVAVAVDVTHATDVPGVDAKELGEHELGSGPVISRGSTIHPRVSELLIEVAKAENIPYTVAVTTARTSTDADVIHLSRAGVPTGLVSIPLRYMHSPVEVADLRDLENAAKLLAAFALRLQHDEPFSR